MFHFLSVVSSCSGCWRETPSGIPGNEIVAELRSILQKRSLRPPYLLVGHSLGGLYLQLFAKLHPDEVAGLLAALRPSTGESDRFIEFKLRLHDEIVRAIPGAEHRRVADSRHYIQKERPEAVIAAIKEVIASGR
jgi:pimeloyl-ACP methyl ester carboxylesterase